MEKEKEEFKPFVPAEKEMKEFSITAVIVGVLLAVVLVRQMHTLDFAWE